MNFVILLIMNLLHKNGIVICHKMVEKNNFLCFVNLSYLIEMCSPTDKTLDAASIEGLPVFS